MFLGPFWGLGYVICNLINIYWKETNSKYKKGYLFLRREDGGMNGVISATSKTILHTCSLHPLYLMWRVSRFRFLELKSCCVYKRAKGWGSTWNFLFMQLLLACLLSHVWLFVTPWTIARQATLSVGFPRQEYWSGLPFPSPGDLPDPGVEPVSPALAGGFFTTESLDDVMRPWERLIFAFSYIILPFLSSVYPCSPEFSHLVLSED